MFGAGDATRILAAFITAAIFGSAIIWPGAGEKIAARAGALSLQVSGGPIETQACPIGESPLTGPFAPIDDVLSVSPLGGVTAPGEILPAPYIRINFKSAEQPFTRRIAPALSPARSDIVAIERRVFRENGKAASSWTIHFRACNDIAFYFDRLDEIDPVLLSRAGGLSAFTELGSADHLATETRIRVEAGAQVGKSDGFDVGLHDIKAAPTPMARPERYYTDTYARAAVFDTKPSLLSAISTDATKARCPLDYLPKEQKMIWSGKLGDAWGVRRVKGENACRTALVDVPGTAQGAWFSDSAHNAATLKVSAIALSPDSIDPDRLIFALHGRLPSLTASLVALPKPNERQRTAATKDFFSFSRGEGRINTPFSEVDDDSVYCYQGLRANFIGPLMNGVLILQKTKGDGGADLLKIEARGDVTACIDLPEPWNFTGNETTFYR